MRIATKVILFTATVAPSQIVFAKVTYSIANAHSAAIEYTLERFEKNTIVEIRNEQGAILSCGRILQITRNDSLLEMETAAERERLPDCPHRNIGKASIEKSKIRFIEIMMPTAEFYAYEDGAWKNIQWHRPVGSHASPFIETAATPTLWRRYTRPPKAVPGVFWPEVRLSTGGYFLSRVLDSGVPIALELDFNLHHSLPALSLFLDFAFFNRYANGNGNAISPHQFGTLTTGLIYALWQWRVFSFSALVGGGTIAYFLDDSRVESVGLRGMASVGFLLSLKPFTNNRDYHKFSFFIEPLASAIFNRNATSWKDNPYLVELRAGVQYAY